MAKGKDGGQQDVRTLLRAFHILDIISRQQKIGISELSRQSGLKKTTVARLVSTLENTGVIEQDGKDKCFSLTLRLFELGSRILETLDLRRQSRPLIEEFVGRQGKSVLVSVLDNTEVVYVDKIEAHELFRIIISVGGRAPAHCTATGKAMLAFLGDDRLEEIFRGKRLALYTENTLTDYASLCKELAEIRRRGYSTDKGERHADLCAVAAPVFDAANQVIAAVSVPRMVAATSDDDLAALGEETAVLAWKISRRLGWNGECNC